MAYIVDKDTRSRMMKSIKAVSRLEDRISSALWRKDMRFRRNVKGMMGKPDLCIKKYKVVIFIDSCFWHCCELHGVSPKSNREFWEKKLANNKRRDIEVNNYYLTSGWNLLRIWEHQAKEDFESTICTIMEFVEQAKMKYGGKSNQLDNVHGKDKFENQ